MATSYTDLWKKDAVLKMFDQQATSYYEVRQSNVKKFDSLDHCDDLEDAKAYLTTQLEAIEHFGSPAQFRIDFYRKLTDAGKFAPENLKASNTFKLTENGEAPQGSYWGNKHQAIGSVQNSELSDIKEMLMAQQSQINALLEDPDEPEDKKPQGVGAVWGMLAGLLENPDIQHAIAQKAIGYLNKILPDPTGQTMTMNTAPRLGNITQDDVTLLNTAVTKLIECGMTIQDFQRLAKIAENKPQFDMYLTMLRTQ